MKRSMRVEPRRSAVTTIAGFVPLVGRGGAGFFEGLDAVVDAEGVRLGGDARVEVVVGHLAGVVAGELEVVPPGDDVFVGGIGVPGG